MPKRNMKHLPERTCIGCRSILKKDDVIRIIAGPAGVLIDYREKLEGRAAYICPRVACIEKALKKETLMKALRINVKPPDVSAFVSQLEADISEKIRSLLRITLKAGKLAAGYSAVQDALAKGRVALLLYARDLSKGTREKIDVQGLEPVRQATLLLTREDFGSILNRELVGVMAIMDNGLADALWTETQRLKGLINMSD
jgi:predicted RNA-binding protein YlxR (DUF448 family)